jgi:hypothetical protein
VFVLLDLFLVLLLLVIIPIKAVLLLAFTYETPSSFLRE